MLGEKTLILIYFCYLFLLSGCFSKISVEKKDMPEPDESNSDVEIFDHDSNLVDSEEADIDEYGNYDGELFFKSKPHGVTRWDVEFRYFVICKSSDGIPVNLSLSENDTCGGRIESSTYIFTPERDIHPEGNCLLSVKCSIGPVSKTQTTEILIPNPKDFIQSILEQVEKKKKEDGITSDSDNPGHLRLINRNKESDYFAYSTGNSIYAFKLSNIKDGIKMLGALHSEKVIENILECTLSGIPHGDGAHGETVISISDDNMLIYEVPDLKNYSFSKSGYTFVIGNNNCTVKGLWKPYGEFICYWSGIKGGGFLPDNFFFFGKCVSNDEYYSAKYKIYSTDGTHEGIVSHSIIQSSDFSISTNNITYDSLSNLYYKFGDKYIYFSKDGKISHSLNISESRAIGFFYDQLIYRPSSYANVLESIKYGKIYSRFEGPYRWYGQGRMNGEYFEIIASHHSGYKILLFKNGDLSVEPIVIDLSDDSYESAFRISSVDNMSIYGITKVNSNETDLIRVFIDNDGSYSIKKPFHTVKNKDFFFGLGVADDRFIFENRDVLYSTIMDAKVLTPLVLIDQSSQKSLSKNIFQYIGKTLANEIVLKYYDYDQRRGNLVVTDGYKENMKTLIIMSENSNINMWNNYILENNLRFVVEDEDYGLNYVDIFGTGKEMEYNSVLRRKDKLIFVLENQWNIDQLMMVYGAPVTFEN